jgi:hypothetical protein
MNKLATVEKITNILPIEGADRIELAELLGWRVVVKKGDFKPGDLCVYIQVDTVVPCDNPVFSFLDKYNYRIKTQKLKNVYSQGICFPLSILPKMEIETTWGIGKKIYKEFYNVGYYKEGQDVTKILNIKKYEKPEVGESHQKGKCSNWFSYLKWKIKRWFGRTGSDSFPSNLVSKTDEDRIQGCPGRINKFIGQECYVTIKHDGTSSTYINDKKKKFIVCSRNTRKYARENVYWEMANKYNIKTCLPIGYDIQGEIIGEKIQGNSEKIKGKELRVFNIHKDKTALKYDEMAAFCVENKLPMADLYYRGIFKWNNVEEIMEEVKKARYKNGTQAEGLVFRLVDDPTVSFKAVSPEYCFKHGE